MTVHVDFWREVTDAHGAPHRVTVMSIDEPDALSDAEAVEKAMDALCASAKVFEWSKLAHGYDVWRDPETPREGCQLH